MNVLLRRLHAPRADAGFTLIEMLVSMLMLGTLSTIFMTMVIGSNNSVGATTAQHDLNEEARLALNRMARELRQASALMTVTSPGFMRNVSLTPASLASGAPPGLKLVTQGLTEFAPLSSLTGGGSIAVKDG